MRIFLSIILLFLFSCSTQKPIEPQPQNKPIVDSVYLPTENIIDLFQNFEKSIKANRKETLNQFAQVRMKDVIDSKTFFPKERILEIKKSVKADKKVIKLNGSADLRKNDTPIVSQWNGTCTAHALAAGIENSLLGQINLSERHMWNKYQKYSCEAAIKSWDKGQSCITLAGKWPNQNIRPFVGYLDKANCNHFLLKTNYIGNDIDKMMLALDNGKPVYIGMSVTKSMLNCDVALNPTSEVTSGGHALSVIGYVKNDKVKGGGYFIVKNSWGAGCGDKGYQYFPFHYCIRNDMYCLSWVIESVK